MADNRRDNKEFASQVCSLRRVSRVKSGGKVLRFSALVVTGNAKGMVGYGLGRASETRDAIQKAERIAQKNLIKVPFFKNRTIFHDICEKYCSAKVYLRKSKEGSGIIAGGSMRCIFEVMGIKDIVCKSIGSSNPHNVVKATFLALKNLKTPRLVAQRRNKNMQDLFVNKENRNEVSEVVSKSEGV